MEDLRITYLYDGEKAGGIHNLTHDGKYTAFTGRESRTFKTLKGAMRWMEKQGFTRAE